jgi:hypothetical protein
MTEINLLVYFFQPFLYTLALVAIHALPYIAVVLLTKAAYSFIFER